MPRRYTMPSTRLRLLWGGMFLTLLMLALQTARAKEGSPAPTVSIEIQVPDVLAGTADIQTSEIKPNENGRETITYPIAAAEEGIGGDITLSAFISGLGKMKEYAVIDSGSDPRLLNAALQGLSAAEFTPAVVDGIVTEMWTTIIVRFQIPDGFVPIRTKPQFTKETLRGNIIYPEQAQSRKVQGNVPVQARIGSKGNVLSVAIPDSINALLAEAVRSGLKKTDFIPAKRRDSALEGEIDFSVDFTLGPQGETWVSIRDRENPFGMSEKVPNAVAPQYDPEELDALIQIPDEVRHNCIEAEIIPRNARVMASVEIDRNGKILQLIDRSPKGSCVAEYFITAVRKLKFRPGTRNGNPTTMWLTLAPTIH